MPEPESRTRTAFQRDRDRIVHSTAFRRLAHKTQVFVLDEGDHFRTRLTHTIEVAQIARSIARALRLDEDLTEALALAHDLGHTPFGHTGEEALDQCLEGSGGFDHNAQSLRIVTKLERRYAGFDGLNLSWEVLEGLVKHNGPLADPLPHAIRAYPGHKALMLEQFAALEAQAAAIADDIAYDAHDIDDGLRAGLFDIADVHELDALDGLFEQLPRGLERPRLINELTRRLITALVEDVIATGLAGIEAVAPASADAVRAAGRPLIGFSPAMTAADRSIKAFLFARMYRHPEVMRVRAGADRIVRDLFEGYLAHPDRLPQEWRRDPDEARRAADYIAGMTDRFAVTEHRRWFDRTPELR